MIDGAQVNVVYLVVVFDISLPHAIDRHDPKCITFNAGDLGKIIALHLAIAIPIRLSSKRKTLGTTLRISRSVFLSPVGALLTGGG